MSYDGILDPLGQSQILPYLKGLAMRGWEVDLISFEKSKDRTIHPELPERIHWHPLRYHRNPPILSTMRDLSQLRRKALQIIRNNPNVEFISHCRGYITAIEGLRLKEKHNLKFIFDMRGFWPDEKVESGHWQSFLYRPVYRYFKKQEMQFLVNADVVVSLTHKGKERIKEISNRLSGIEVIRTCVDFSRFQKPDPEKKARMRRSLGIEDHEHVFVYAGSLGGNYPVDELLTFFTKISTPHASPRLLVVSPQHDLIHGESGVITVQAAHSEMPALLCAADTGIICYKEGPSNVGRCPTKLAEYIGCGLSVAYPRSVGDLDELNDVDVVKEEFSLERGIKQYDKIYSYLQSQESSARLQYAV